MVTSGQVSTIHYADLAALQIAYRITPRFNAIKR